MEFSGEGWRWWLPVTWRTSRTAVSTVAVFGFGKSLETPDRLEAKMCGQPRLWIGLCAV